VKKVLGILAIIILFIIFCFKIVQINSRFLSSYKNGSFCLVNKLAYLFVTPQRGDTVILRDKTYMREEIIRLIGLPNESLEFKNGRIFINGQLLDEPYLASETNPAEWDKVDQKEITIPTNNYVVLSDTAGTRAYFYNQNSITSRNDIVGKVEVCLGGRGLTRSD